ncbi:hypothetical protein BHE74_00028057 [Ensete ventricosum]|nr:hypothetical protein BHE74_00028057 [Ensete ventricosum]
MRQTTLPVFYTRSAVDATGDLSDVASSTRLAARGRRRPRCRSPTDLADDLDREDDASGDCSSFFLLRFRLIFSVVLWIYVRVVALDALLSAMDQNSGNPSWKLSLPHVCVATISSFLFGCGLCADLLDARVVNEPLESISMDLGFAGNTLAEGNFHSFCEYLWLIVGLLQRGRVGEAEIEFERLLGLFHVKSAMAELSRSDRGDESESIRYSELFYGRHFRAGPVPGLLLPEIFPNKIRAKAMALCMSVHWVVNFFVGLLFLRLLEQLGAKMLYSMFASFCLMAAIFVGKNVIETKGKSLQEIEISLLSAV